MDTSRVKEILEAIKTPEDEERMMSLVGGVIANRGLGLLCHLMKNLGLSRIAVPFPLIYESNAETHVSLDVLTQEKAVVLYRTDKDGKPFLLDQNEQTMMLNQDAGPYPNYRVAPFVEFLAFLYEGENETNLDDDFKEKVIKLVKKFMHKEGLRVGEMIEEVTNNVTRH